jgi:hypothetical protein
MRMDRGKRGGRKLLIASLGVAAVSYVGCGDDNPTAGNLVAPPGYGGASGNGGASGSGGTSGSAGASGVGAIGGLPDSGSDAKDSSPLDVVAPPDVATDVRNPRDG